MGIWIKTQRGEIVECNCIFAKQLTSPHKEYVEYKIIANGGIVLGRYVYDKHIKVIEKIQEHINKLEYFRATGNISASVPAVFEMPKE